MLRGLADVQDRAIVTLDADFANVLRYPVAESAGTIRLRLHPATEAAIDSLIRLMMPRLRDIDMRGKLAIVESDKIRIRG